MKRAELEKQLAVLESVNDQLETEITFIDELLKNVGFPDGLESAKLVALEMLQEGAEESECEN